MIEIKNVSKSFGAAKKAVNKLNLTIRPGEIFGFLGPNGAGKTTTLKMITGLLQADEGSIRVQGFDINKEPLQAKAAFAFVPDDPNVFLRLRGIEYLRFIADIYEVSSSLRQERINTLAARFGLSNDLGKRIQAYSHGMRQKIVLIGALLHNPPVWILDEPMSGLDPASAFVLKQMMREHADQGNTVLFSTHVLEVAEKICDCIAVINEGELIFTGDMTALRSHFDQNSSLEQIFLEMTGDNPLADNQSTEEV